MEKWCWRWLRVRVVIFFFVEVNIWLCFFFQAEDGIRDYKVTGVQTCALPISLIVEGSVLIFSEYQLLIIYCLSYKKIAIKTRFWLNYDDTTIYKCRFINLFIWRFGDQEELWVLPLCSVCQLHLSDYIENIHSPALATVHRSIENFHILESFPNWRLHDSGLEAH